jgi:hypothetical protein
MLEDRGLRPSRLVHPIRPLAFGCGVGIELPRPFLLPEFFHTEFSDAALDE